MSQRRPSPSPDEQRPARTGRIAERDDGRQDRGKQEAIDAVEQPAMARDEMAHVLGAKAALHRALNQVAELAGERQRYADKGKAPPRSAAEGYGESITDQGRRQRADDESAPGLARRDAGRKFRSADEAPGGVRGRVGGPGDGKEIKHGHGAE